MRFEARSAEGRALRGSLPAQLTSARRSPPCGRSIFRGCSRRSRQAGREAGSAAHAAPCRAIRAEGPRPLRPRGDAASRISVAHPALSRPHRSPRARRPAMRTDRGSAGRAGRRTANGAAHVEMGGGPTMPSANCCSGKSEVHGRQGRRRVRRICHRRRGLRPVRAIIEHYWKVWSRRRWPTITTGSSRRAHMLRENTQKVIVWGQGDVQVLRVNMDVRQIDLGLVGSWSTCGGGAAPSRRCLNAERRETAAGAAQRAARKPRPASWGRARAAACCEEDRVAARDGGWRRRPKSRNR